MRLVVALCEVTYTGRLTAVLPEAARLLVLKADGSVLVHDDTGGYKPLNWMRSVFRPEVDASNRASGTLLARFGGQTVATSVEPIREAAAA
jgi:endonuclease